MKEHDPRVYRLFKASSAVFNLFWAHPEFRKRSEDHEKMEAFRSAIEAFRGDVWSATFPVEDKDFPPRTSYYVARDIVDWIGDLRKALGELDDRVYMLEKSLQELQEKYEDHFHPNHSRPTNSA